MLPPIGRRPIELQRPPVGVPLPNEDPASGANREPGPADTFSVGPGHVEAARTRRPAPIDHLVLFFTACDNALESHVFADIAKLTSSVGPDPAAATRSVHLHHLIDTKKLGRYQARLIDGTMAMTPVHGQLDMSDPNTLAAFVREAVRSTPSKKVSLVFQGHGDTGLMLTESRSFLSVKQLREVLECEGVKLHLLALDTCLMSNLEALYELRNVATWITANEDYCPWDGIISPSFLPTLRSDSASDDDAILALARAQAAKNAGIKAASDVAVIATRDLGDLAELVSSLGLQASDFTKATAVDVERPDAAHDLYQVVMGCDRVTPAKKAEFSMLFERCVRFYAMNASKKAAGRTHHGLSILKSFADYPRKQAEALAALEYFALGIRATVA